MPESRISGQAADGAASGPSGARGALSGRVLAERYRVIELLGPASASPPAGDALYRAERIDGGVQALLWHLAPPASAEIDLLGRLRARASQTERVAAHTPVVAAIDECLPLEDGSVAVLMAIPAGPTLAEVLRRDGPFSVERAVRTAAKVAEAMEVAHDLGAVHGGLGAQNVVALDTTGEGVALLRFGMDWIWLATRAGTLGHGEPQPGIAPEQVAGEDPTRRSDVYGLGALLYTMLAGTSPRSSGARRPPMLSELRADVSPSLDRIVGRALDPRPERRQRDMTDFFNDLWTELDPLWGARSPRRSRADGLKGLKWRRWADLTARVVMCGMILTVGVFVARPLLFSRPGDIYTQSPPAKPGPVVTGAPAKAAAPASPSPAAPGRTAPPVASEPVVVTSEDPVPAASREAEDRASQVAVPPAVPVERAETSPRPSPARRARAAVAEEPRRITRETPAAPTPSRAERPTPTRSPVAPSEPDRPRPSRDTGEDPGAIIDWALQRGPQRD